MLTIFRLEKDESPEAEYGEGAQNQYQDTEGIKRSSRRIPADLPKSKLVSSSFEKLDPTKQLKEAGYPFDHIATELTDLHGKFEVVSTDVRLLKDQFEKQTKEFFTTPALIWFISTRRSIPTRRQMNAFPFIRVAHVPDSLEH